MQQFAFVTPTRLFGWGARVITACGLAIVLGSQAAAQTSDGLGLSAGGLPPLQVFNTEASELLGGDRLRAGFARGNSIDFLTPLAITRDEIDRIVETLDRAIAVMGSLPEI